ncbi:monoacylglycerol lipase abhd6-A-like [Acropora muricata]|uniref:monoacylglycerol lipase abhd6-A-like n=1 Tax=Acropora muricata TaxID=159855 RepID=UPI0034E5B78A
MVWLGIFLPFVGLTAFAVFLVWFICVVLYFIRPQIFANLIHRLIILRGGFALKYVSVGDFRFSYIERGHHGKAEHVILMVHGFSGDKGVWCRMGDVFPSTYHLIAVDLPGHGYTTRKYHDDHSILALVAKLHQFVLAVGLNKRKFHLVGMSMGGFLAGIYAAKYSSLLSSLVLICPAGVKAPRLSEYIMEVANGRKNYLLPKNPDDFRFMLKKISHRDVFIPSFVINIMSAARQSAHEFYEKVMAELSHPDQRFLLEKFLEDINVPTLTLWGDKDKILDRSAVDIIAEKVKNCKIEIVDNCGHAIIFERPFRSAKLILQFIHSLPSHGSNWIDRP